MFLDEDLLLSCLMEIKKQFRTFIPIQYPDQLVVEVWLNLFTILEEFSYLPWEFERISLVCGFFESSWS